MGYEILMRTIEVRGYFSDVASHRLHTQGSRLAQRHGQLLLANATILKIPVNHFCERQNFVKELRNQEIVGNVYLSGNDALCLLFPFDLVRQGHVSITKWRIAA